MAAFLRSVLKKPHVKPLLWNCTTYGLLYGGAEFTQQSKAKYYDKDIKQYDMPKVGRFWVLGTFAFPPILYAWYKILESRPWLLGTSPQAVIGKVLIDQAVSAPIVLFLFFSGMSLMEGKEDIFKEFKEKFKSTYMVSCCFWLPAQAINFALVPQTFRVVYIGTASFFWVNILSICKSKGIDVESHIKGMLFGTKKQD